jgi:thiamine-monophosphate kinase
MASPNAVQPTGAWPAGDDAGADAGADATGCVVGSAQVEPGATKKEDAARTDTAFRMDKSIGISPIISTMQESEFLNIIRQVAKNDAVAIPIGDDLAGLNLNDLILVGIDQVLEGVHFDLKQHTVEQAARKAVLRNLSDCAAMACLPVAIVASVALPRTISRDSALKMFHAMRACASEYGATLMGGDTGSWPGPLAISVAVLGKADGIKPVLRSGAKPGDTLYVTGPLGGSIISRHMDFVPRIALARELAKRYAIHAMLDLSDGLSRDLPRLCDMSRVGATLFADRVPIHEHAKTIEQALHDGEDYELLFASPGCDDARVIAVGQIDEQPGVRLRTNAGDHVLEPRGWDHSLGD